MTTAATSLLGLALPVTGELSGTWGDTVNNSITSLLDSAIAGTTTLSTDADVTLTTTTLAANQAREAIILWTASGTVTRNITAPAQSKIYTVINKTGSTQSIVLRGAGPTTGVTIVAGESAVCAWNGTDFIKISNTGGSASFTNVTVTGTTTLSGLTASTALALNASKEVVSVTNTGTGNNVLSASPTLTGTVAGASLTLSSLTSGRVTYAGTSGLLQDSANLTFNGTTLTANTIGAFTLGGTIAGGGNQINNVIIGTTTPLAGAFTTLSANSTVTLSGGTANGVAYLNGSKALTTGSALTFDGTNLGNSGNYIGTAATGRLTKSDTTGRNVFTGGTTGGATDGAYVLAEGYNYGGTAAGGQIQLVTAGATSPITFAINGTEGMRLTSTGLGIGTTTPSFAIDIAKTTAVLRVQSTTGTNGAYMLTTNTGGDFYFGRDNSTGATFGTGTAYSSVLWSAGAYPMAFFTDGTERMRIDSSGYTTVGSTNMSPFTGTTATQQLIVGRSVSDYTFAVNHTGAGPYGIFIAYNTDTNSTGNSVIDFRAGSNVVQRFAVRSNGGIANYSANNVNLSDERTKTAIVAAGSYLDKICAIPVRTFKYKDQTDDLLNLGVIAQEVEAVAPELVDVSGFGETPEDGVPLKAIYQTDLQYALMKCIQELKAIVDTQAAKIAALENK